MDKIKINGSTNFMGIKLPIIEGGFGEDKKCVLAKDVAGIHKVELKEVNQSINRLIKRKRIREGIHFINLLESDLKVTGGDLEFKTSNAQKYAYLLSERGYSSLIKYMDDDKSWEVHDELIDHYFALREQVQHSISESEQAIINIVNAENDIEQALAIRQYQQTVTKPLADEIDMYERFLCNNMSTLTKSELAMKLDTKPQTLAALFKKLGIYTPTSQVSNDFLQKFDNVKMITETKDDFVDKKGKPRSRKNWQWTGEGSKELVDYLIELDKVVFTENKGFKLVSKK